MRGKVLAILLMVLYFVMVTSDLAQATDIVVTSTVNVSARVGPEEETSTSTPISTSTGSGGGAILPAVSTQVAFSGLAYPLARVTLLRNGVLVNVSYATLDAKFNIGLVNLEPGWFNFVIYANDSDGNQSASYSLPIYVTKGAITTVSGLMIAPTIRADRLRILQGQVLNISGQTVPGAAVAISVKAAGGGNLMAQSDQRGWYYYKLDTNSLVPGFYQAQSKSTYKNLTSPESLTASFFVLAKGETVPVEEKPGVGACKIVADLNGDCRVNLVDFSILAYWYKRPGVPARLDLQKNGSIDLADFSVMAYYWTG